MSMEIIGGTVLSSLILYLICSVIIIIMYKVIASIFSLKISIGKWANTTILIVTPFLVWGLEDDYSKFIINYPDADHKKMHMVVYVFFGVFLCAFIQMLLTHYHEGKINKQREKELDIIKRDAELKELDTKQKQEEQAKWQLELDREIERERRLAEVRHDSTIMAMRSQVALYAEYKEKGLSVEKEIFEMREKLLKMEGEENKAMLDEIKTTLDSLS